VATLPLAVLLTGCVSTQTVAARARLVDARILTSQTGTEVTRANPAVSVGLPVVIRDGTATAIVVTARNGSDRALTDLPISVGVRTPSGRPRYLNRSSNLDYFESHVAAIGARAVTEWVFTTTQPLPRGRPFATVGVSPLHPTVGASLPSLAVSLRAGRDDLTLGLSIANRSAIPQYDLPVYAVALRNGHDVAAGRTTVTHLETNGTTTSSLSLLGSAHYTSLRLIATPTIFH
jgi:hypothetical protein